MCNPISPLFGIEKTGKRFSRLKRRRESVATGGFHSKECKCPEHTFFSSTALTKVTALLLRYVHVAYGKIAARQARGYGVLYKVNPFWQECYFSYTQIGNRTRFSDQLAVARWLRLNVSFMFSWRKSASLIKLNTKIYSVHCSTTLHRVFYIHKSNIWTKFLADRQAGQKGESCWLCNNA